MIIILGKRAYGSVKKLGSAAIRIMFRHVHDVPIVPACSADVDTTVDAAFDINQANFRRMVCGYVRLWTPLIAVLGFAGMAYHPNPADQIVLGVAATLSVIGFFASFVVGMQVTDAQVSDVSNLMQRHCGSAASPPSRQQRQHHLGAQITQRAQARRGMLLAQDWYRHALQALTLSTQNMDLAVQRARTTKIDCHGSGRASPTNWPAHNAASTRNSTLTGA